MTTVSRECSGYLLIFIGIYTELLAPVPTTGVNPLGSEQSAANNCALFIFAVNTNTQYIMSKKTTAVSAPSSLTGSLEQVSGKKPSKAEMIELMARAMYEDHERKVAEFKAQLATLRLQAIELLRGVPNNILVEDQELSLIGQSNTGGEADYDLQYAADIPHDKRELVAYVFKVRVPANAKDPSVKKLTDLVKLFQQLPQVEYKSLDFFKTQLQKSYTAKYDFDKLPAPLKSQLLDHAHTLIKGSKQPLDV